MLTANLRKAMVLFLKQLPSRSLSKKTCKTFVCLQSEYTARAPEILSEALPYNGNIIQTTLVLIMYLHNATAQPAKASRDCSRRPEHTALFVVYKPVTTGFALGINKDKRLVYGETWMQMNSFKIYR